MYDPTRQYRCDIIRSKAISQMDDLLASYSLILLEICPCKKDIFVSKFNSNLMKVLSSSESTPKRLNNHRTESAGMLLGMYYRDEDETRHISERTMKFLEDSDQPAFFKDMCFKLQFPNGMQKESTIKDRINDGINIRPCSYLLKVLMLSISVNLKMTKRDIAYYVLNSLDVLQRKVDPQEVVDYILADKGAGNQRSIPALGRADSFIYQHIREQIKYMEFANLVIVDRHDVVSPNLNEPIALQIFADAWNQDLLFDVSKYDVNNAASLTELRYEWQHHYSKLSDIVSSFATTSQALGIEMPDDNEALIPGGSRIELGDEGEAFVYDYEKKRVAQFSRRLVNKVLSMGKTKGLGYDIKSVIAENGEYAEYAKYIEVKSTKRVTEPDCSSPLWQDTVYFTRNEWIASQQHKEYYEIFRVYFVTSRVILIIIKNLHKKCEDKLVSAIPTTYRLDFGNEAVDELVDIQTGEEIHAI